MKRPHEHLCSGLGNNQSVLNLQSRDCGYSGGLLGFNSEPAKGVNEWERAVEVS